MRKMVCFVFVFSMMLVFSDFGQARPWRVNQIPNGGKFSCANCHIDPNGGGARNKFGQAVESGFLDGNGNVVWGLSLAEKDSDGDGVSNGAELQDAIGAWTIGQAQPGDVNLVSNPGDASSTTAVAQLDLAAFPVEFGLGQNYPNPFNPVTEIRFFLPENSSVSLDVFNVLGQKVKTLVEKQFSAGSYAVDWDGTNEFGEPVRSGVYMYRIQTEKFSDVKRMILMK